MNNLKKELGLLEIFCIASGAMISSGLFILPGLASARTGPSLFLSYMIASFLALPAMFSNAELSTAMPKSGGDYFYITRSMGYAVGTIGGASSWFSLSLKSAFALIGMGAYASLITNIPIKVFAVFCCIFFMALNLRGVKHAGKLQNAMVFSLMGLLVLYIFKGFGYIDIKKYVPFMPKGFSSVLSTAGFVFVSYCGLTKIVSVAEEVKNPGRNLPLGMILSLVVVGIIYSLTVFVTTGLLEPEILHNSLAPISTAAEVSLGPLGVVVMSVAAVLAFFSTANAGIMSASRYPMAMSRDKILPSFFQNLNSKYRTPHFSIFTTVAFMIFAITFLELETLVKVASILVILLYISANVSVIIMRESKMVNYRPVFHSPLYPWMQIAGTLGCVTLLVEMGRVPLLVSLIFILATLLWFFVYVKSRVSSESALIHVLERITAKDADLKSDYISSELRQILRERDQIVEDRFDLLIKQSCIIDVDGSLSIEDFFKNVSSVLAEKLKTDKAEIYKMLIEREKESSTVIRGGLAIPHIIIKGTNKFTIMLARCRQGVIFPGTSAGVKTIFILAGSKDERNFHLRALAAIAEIAQQKDFDKKWLQARTTDDLRDLVLLSERKRSGMPKQFII